MEECGISFRKRFLWQIAESELTSIQVAIKRRNLINPIKSAAPLIRRFDPGRHNLLVHLRKKTDRGGNGSGRAAVNSIFDRRGVICNKASTPSPICNTSDKEKSTQRTSSSKVLDKDSNRGRKFNNYSQSESDEISADNEGGGARFHRKDSKPACFHDPFQNELRKANATKHSENRSRCSTESGQHSDFTKNTDSRPSTSGYNNRSTNQLRDQLPYKSKRSITPQSAKSDRRESNVHHKQRIQQQESCTESNRRNKRSRHRSSSSNSNGSNDECGSHSRPSQSARSQPVHTDEQSYKRSSRPTRSRSKFRSPPSYSRYHGDSRDRDRRYSSKNRSNYKSTSVLNNKRSPNRTKIYSSNRSQSSASLRPDPSGLSSRSRDSVNFQQRRHRIVESNVPSHVDINNPELPIPYHHHPYHGGVFFGGTRAIDYSLPTTPSMLDLGPYIQYIPVAAIAPPHARGKYQRYPHAFYQPLKVYNNRPIPQFNVAAAHNKVGISTSTVTSNNDNTDQAAIGRVNVIGNKDIAQPINQSEGLLNDENHTTTLTQRQVDVDAELSTPSETMNNIEKLG